jgi:hypothetical protein
LAEFFPELIEPLPRWMAERLRRDITAMEEGDPQRLAALLDTVLETIIGLPQNLWQKAGSVGSKWSIKAITGETIRPRRVWQEPNGGVLPVFVADEPALRRGRGDTVTRLGIGRGRRPIARVIEWLRKSDAKVALVTNGRQWRLIHAGPDYDAWCEWDISLWFEEGEPGLQVTALRALLGPEALAQPAPGQPSFLLAAIQATRRGQAELSGALGERVRLAVERLIRDSKAALDTLLDSDPNVTRRDIYIAACRIVMRCVVILFAEARELLPRNNPIYEASYGLQGLREQLDRDAGGRAESRLRHRFSAWPRLLALFRLLYYGSGHEALLILRYGGGLFQPGAPDSPDPVLRALAALENPANDVSDAAIAEILSFLTYARVRVRQGRAATIVSTPIDFSQLDTEYIGILYEGLLDYELRRVDDAVPLLFLNLGDQPALPLTRLEEMDDKALASLVEKLKKKAKPPAATEESGEGEEESDEEPETPDEEATEETELEETQPIEAASPSSDLSGLSDSSDTSDAVLTYRRRAFAWARRTVEAGKIVAKPRGKMTAEKQRDYEQAVESAANRLIARLILPGEYYLVRWGGTRKGAGTFYTKPALAGPTVRRTIEPLCYQPRTNTDENRSDESVHVGPCVSVVTPETILALKVCDPACGSGSFLVAALRYLTQALYDSLFAHRWLEATDDGRIVVDHPPDPQPSWFWECVHDLPTTTDNPEDHIRARLKRVVVERCLYGVDIDPLAVELCRLALWVETMDPYLPFTFLDHKIKVGNSLVGCWFDRFQDYPVMAWEREGGDKNHTTGVHFPKEAWTKAIKKAKNDVVKPELKHLIESLDPVRRAQLRLPLPEFQLPEPPEKIHEDMLDVFRRLHEERLTDPDSQARAYSEGFGRNPHVGALRFAFDTWCAVWFWPADRLNIAPTPSRFFNPPEATRCEIERLAQEYRFFHWEIEFSDVFAQSGSGFDAMVGNPPWEIQKPNSKEWFSNSDPLYRAYGKQEALRKQKEFFDGKPEIERQWLNYTARLKALSNWTKFAGSPFGDSQDGQGGRFSLSRSASESDELHNLWRGCRAGRAGFGDPEHPFLHQGSADINTYKMFLEQSRALLRSGGRLGLVVPSGIYTDRGSTDLRTLFLHRCRWDWLFGFENRDGIFDIHRSFKFCPVIIAKGGGTHAIRAAFMHRDLKDWEEAREPQIDREPQMDTDEHRLESEPVRVHPCPSVVLLYPRERVEQFSPKSRAILEIRSPRDLEILEKMYANGVLLGDDSPDGWGIRYACEFHMTNDSHLFPPRPSWEERGYRPDEYGHWLKGKWRGTGVPPVNPQRPHMPEIGAILSRDGAAAIAVEDIEDVALPLYEGRMIGQFDFSQKGWVSGKGRGAVWREIPWDTKVIEPQYLMGLGTLSESPKGYPYPKISYMRVSSATNSRTMISTYLEMLPAGDSVFFYRSNTNSFHDCLTIVAFFGSFPFDYQVRNRLGGLNMSEFVIDETALPNRHSIRRMATQVFCHITGLTIAHPSFASMWLSSVSSVSPTHAKTWRHLWALTPHERLRLRCILDAVVAHLYGLDEDDFRWILRDCDHPLELSTNKSFTRTLDPKGFWRVDKTVEPELRHIVLAQVAFRDLKEKGLDAFLAQNDGEGWMLPETLRLADYALGHDNRARQSQPVAARLGPRFYPFQLEQSAADSWEECRRHAENIKLIRNVGSRLVEPLGAVQEEEYGKKTISKKRRSKGKQIDLFEQGR